VIRFMEQPRPLHTVQVQSDYEVTRRAVRAETAGERNATSYWMADGEVKVLIRIQDPITIES
jgi:hypothetical protein